MFFSSFEKIFSSFEIFLFFFRYFERKSCFKDCKYLYALFAHQFQVCRFFFKWRRNRRWFAKRKKDYFSTTFLYFSTGFAKSTEFPKKIQISNSTLFSLEIVDKTKQWHFFEFNKKNVTKESLPITYFAFKLKFKCETLDLVTIVMRLFHVTTHCLLWINCFN